MLLVQRGLVKPIGTITNNLFKFSNKNVFKNKIKIIIKFIQKCAFTIYKYHNPCINKINK